MAAAVAAQLASSPLVLRADCKAVVDTLLRWKATRTWGSRMNDGFVRFIATQKMADPFETVCKIKAHRAVSSAIDEEDARDIAGNNEVDLLAKAALLMHPREPVGSKIKRVAEWDAACRLINYGQQAIQ